MTRYEIIGKAIRGELKWVEAADILRVSARHMLRLRERYEKFGMEGMGDKRTGRRMPSRIPKDEVDEICRLKRDVYPDFTPKHFHRFAVAKHGVKMSYTYFASDLRASQRLACASKMGRATERSPNPTIFEGATTATQAWPGKRRILNKMGRLRGRWRRSGFGTFARGRRRREAEVNAFSRRFKSSSCRSFGLLGFGPMRRRTRISRRVMCRLTTGGMP